MNNRYFPAPPEHLKKQKRGVRLVTREDAALHMDHYNQWAADYNRREELFQRGGEWSPPGHDSIHGHIITDLSRRKIWQWFPNEGPMTLVVSHEINTQYEYPLTLFASLQGFNNLTEPRPFIHPDQITWAAWVNFWHDAREVK